MSFAEFLVIFSVALFLLFDCFPVIVQLSSNEITITS